MKLYVKGQNGRYEELGERWDGFPSNGWWVVADGRRNLVVPIDSPRPLEKLKYQQHRNEIVDRLTKEGSTSLSFHDVVEKTLNLLEEIVNETDN
jgi:hypothetical protein